MNDLPYWFWFQIDRSAGSPIDWLAIGAVTVLLVIAVCARQRPMVWPRVLAVWIAGYALQLIMAHTEGEELAPLRRCLLQSGHGTFVTLAIEHGSREDLVANYFELVRTGILGQYAPTKPPGQLLLYVGTERLASWWFGAETSAQRLEAFASFATVVWPAIAAAPVFPLAAAARRLTGDTSTAVLAAALYVVTPCFVLIQMHTDQVFFPLLVTTALWLGTIAAYRARPGAAVATGVVFATAVFCSFGLVAYAPVVLGAAVLSPRDGRGSRARRFWWVGAAVFGTLYTVYLALLHGLGFDWYADFRFASARHAEWKHWDGTLHDYLYFGFLNTVEFGFWLGGVVWCLASVAVVEHLRRAGTAWRRPSSALAVGLVLFFVAVLLFGRTKAEVARLWLFVVPVTCLFAAELLRSCARRISLAPVPERWPLALAVACQVAFVWLMKQHMDFH